MKDGHFLYEDRPAVFWQEAFPIGSGELGGMVFGGIHEDKLCLNHDTLWSGYPGLEEGYPGGNDDHGDKHEIFRQARSLVMEGKNLQAQTLLQTQFEGNDSQAYMPLGDLCITYNFLGEEQNYRRCLDLRTALCETSFEVGGKTMRRCVFASCPAQVIVYRVEAAFAFDMKVSLCSPLKSRVEAETGSLTLKGEAPSYFDRSAPKNKLCYWEKPENRGMTFEGGLRALTDGIVTAGDGLLIIENAKCVTLFFSADTSFIAPDVHPFINGKNPHLCVSKRLTEAINTDYQKLLSEHITDYQRYYNRVELDLGSIGKEKVPTSQRLLDFLEDKSDVGLYTLIFNFGRYLLIAGSREGSQPTNLQGIWNDKIDPPWNSNYTTNINTEMNYWPALPVNLPELTSPLHQMVQECIANGQRTATKYYQAKGFTIHHNVDIWRHTVPVQGSSQWSFWPMASGWLCRHLFDYYEYTGDIDFLREKAYPIMREAAAFYLDVLSFDEEGKLALIPSTSPENRFYMEGEPVSVAKTSTMTMSIIRELFLNVLMAEDILMVEKSTEIEAALSRLWMPSVGSKGQLLEWDKEYEEVEPHHRHTSHLYGLYPAALITEDTPTYFDACRRTLELRGDDGTGWSLGWKINFWARLNDGDHALLLLNNQLRFKNPDQEAFNYTNSGGTYPNLFDAHPPFQIDGNFGCVSGICEMLVRSVGDKITLLPALPSAWKNGSVKGIRVKGGGLIDIAWEDGSLLFYHVHGGKDGQKLYYKGKRLQ